ncbi:transcription factor/nuclear export subunit protein 2-domain-containing protein [Dendryphion nanum]|uniref:THO complex subunit 2 n=1 Tax=Dendryphion nanum TaxID=256645 RepID=A0A9P9IJF8_9PLEO|nr:transcription factor/nuclear export subunit protein 2-domain-containing protein [Dendryphion nanum]
MANGNAKRKRGDQRTESSDNNRSSPHRPQNLGLAGMQHQQNNTRGGRRGSRSGGSGRGASNSVPHSPSTLHQSPTTMSPPSLPPSKSQAQLSASTPSTPAPQTSSNPPPPQISAPDASKIPAHNEYLRTDIVAAWKGDGRTKLVQEASERLVKGDWLQLSVVFDEFVHACIDHTVHGEELGHIVRDILASSGPGGMDPVSIFLDTVSTVTDTGTPPPSLKLMLEATGIDPLRMRSELENNFLIVLNLVRPTFSRVGIRKATHALYRQSNYNLLREETEGYSKLITELFTTVHNEFPTTEIIDETFQRVKALIGAFDLDVGRVLDVTLDVFANLLVKHTRFFVRFLRVSSWWPELKIPHGIEWEEPLVSTLPVWASPDEACWFYTDEQRTAQLSVRDQRDEQFWKQVKEHGIKAWFELGARRITSDTTKLEALNTADQIEGASASDKKPLEPSDFEKTQKWSQDWMAETNTLPPTGNRIAAQLLGFKLRFYASDARDANDTLPDNLIHLAALLIKIGFISLVDLYPHIYPLDEDMPAHREKLVKAKKEKDDKLSGRTTNALAMAGALPDEGAPPPASVARLRESASNPSSNPESQRGTPPRAEEEHKEKLPDPVDQKIVLLRSLLLVGAIPEALYILCRFPWLMDVYPDLHTYIFRIAHQSLSKVYEASRPISTDIVPVVPRRSSLSGAPPRSTDYPARRTLRWAKLEERDAGDSTDYRFYWEDWLDNVPVCQTADDVLSLCNTLLGLVGIACGKDALLLTKIARIARKDYMDDTSKTNHRRWFQFSSTFLGPALSYSGENPGAVNEVWELFKHFDTASRYMIYRNWFAGPGKQKAHEKFAEAIHVTKGLFGRVSTENTREMGRAIAKPAYASPGIVFEKALKTSENYSNMIEPLVECCRYLTYLGYDCLNWTFINLFKDNARSTVQDDGMLTRPWLRNVALFMGKAYRRYNLMDPTPILQFLVDQLSKRQLFGLQILEQLVLSMGGITLNASLSEGQVHGISAGPLLKAFTLEVYLGDQRHLARGHGKRLLKCLKESNLAAKILLILALELQTYVDRPELEDAPLKVISNNLDALHLNFEQYLEFLRYNLSIQEFDAIVPGAAELMTTYGIEPEIAFTIARESLIPQVNAARTGRNASLSKTRSPSVSVPNVGSPLPEASQANGNVPRTVENADASSGDTEMAEDPPAEDTEMKDTTTTNAPASTPPSPGHINPQIDALVTELKTKMPDVYENHICPTFFVTFWQMSLVDVFTSSSMKEMKEYTAAWKHFAEKASRVPFDRRDVSTQSAERRRAEVNGLNGQSAAFRLEAKEILEAALRTRDRLQEEMHHWFDGTPMVDARSEELHDVILQDCFLPRIRQSSQDAQFAAAMLKFMHEIGVPGFRTMKFLDQLFRHKMLTQIFFMCTTREASNLGRFFSDVLKELNTWHTSQASYVKSSQGRTGSLPGFGRTFNADRTPSSFLEYEDFRRLLFKWQSQLFKALECCLKSDEFMQIRNAVNAIKAMAGNFPKVDTMGKTLLQTVQNISVNDSRDDIKLLAMSLIGDFKKHERSWISPANFHHTRNALQATNVANVTNRTDSEQATPQASEPNTSRVVPISADSTSQSSSINGQPESKETEQKEASTAGDTSTVHSEVQDSYKHTPTVTQSGLSSSHGQRNGNEQRSGTSHSLAVQHPARPDSRGNSGQSAPGNRASHALPPRPDSHPSRQPRPLDRGGDRPAEYIPPSRNENRTNATPEYGRHDRPRDGPRDSFGDRREMSPGRGSRARTPERNSGWGSRDRDPRDFQDERSMRPPPRDIRGDGRGPPPYHSGHPRDSRDPRDHRDPQEIRHPRDSRGPLPPTSIDSRARLHTNPSTPDNAGPYRREHQPHDRNAPLPPRPQLDRPQSNVPSPGPDRPVPPSDRAMMNPERAAQVFSEDRGRNERDRDTRRHQSPRRGDDRPPAYPPRHEAVREHRDTRNIERVSHEQTPPHVNPANQRRDEPNTGAPTGPRGGRNDAPARVTRDAFMASQGTRPPAHTAQDPNYGRLNAPAETIPSGPRNPSSDRRDTPRRDPEPSRPNISQPPPVPAAPSAAQNTGTGVHPSRLSQITGTRPPPIQTDVPGAPSGPRASARTPQGPAGSPLTPRGPPTGPSGTDRNPRRNEGNHLRAINNVLSGNVSTAPPEERPAPSSAPQIRGRGGTRATNGLSNTPAPAAGSSHPGTPNAGRPETQQVRGDRSEHGPSRPDNRQDDGRQDTRGHREGRRRPRSRSADRGERRTDDRATRNGFEEKPPRNEEQERASDRERGSGRDRRGSEREGNRREKERDGRDRRDRPAREEGRVSSRNEESGARRGPPPVSEVIPFQTDGRGVDNVRGGRGSERRDDRNDRPRDSRGGNGRKRDRGDEPPHGDPKRARRSN